MNRPLELEAWFLNSISVEFVPTSQGGTSAPPIPQFQLSVQVDPENPLRYMVELGVAVNQTDVSLEVPYRIRAVITGVFRFEPGTSNEDVRSIIPVNGPTILYGILRGHVDGLTAVSFGPRYSLPTVYFRDVLRELAAQQNQGAAAPAGETATKVSSRKKRASGKRAGA